MCILTVQVCVVRVDEDLNEQSLRAKDQKGSLKADFKGVKMTILATFENFLVKNFLFGQNDKNGEKDYNAPWYFSHALGHLEQMTKIFKIFRFEKLSLAFVCHLTLWPGWGLWNLGSKWLILGSFLGPKCSKERPNLKTRGQNGASQIGPFSIWGFAVGGCGDFSGPEKSQCSCKNQKFDLDEIFVLKGEAFLGENHFRSWVRLGFRSQKWA